MPDLRGTVLVVDDEADDNKSLASDLREQGFEVESVYTFDDFVALMDG